ncbi:MAG: hypothetical protein WCK09_18735 [Bacteroidota bacterium]
MISGKNDLLAGYTGKLGNSGMYKRVVKGKEIIQRCPHRKKKKDKHERPAQVRRFQMAIRWAKMTLKSREIWEIYCRTAHGFSSATSMAIKDYLIPAEITKVVISGYRGRAGYRIVIRVDNIVPVKSVEVSISNPEGETIESGQAVVKSSGFLWHYVTTRSNPFYKGSRIRIISHDLPNHRAELTRVL